MPARTAPPTHAARLIESGLFDAQWYAARHGDVALSHMDPLSHFLAIGWPLGRNPGPGFDRRAYLETYKDVAMSGADALSHYLLSGAREGRSPHPWQDSPLHRARSQSDILRLRLHVAGQLSVLGELARLAEAGSGDEAAFAARDLALWHLRDWRGTFNPQSAGLALQWADFALRTARDSQLRRALLTLMITARGAADAPAPSQDQLDRWQEDELVTADTFLALTGCEKTPEHRLTWINHALECFGIAPLALSPLTKATPAYDGLGIAGPPSRVDGPLVSVLIAAYNAQATLPTALRAMTEQSWTHLDIIVIDDCSTDETVRLARRAAQDDPRIRVLQQDRNAGAYAARNRGLSEAKGAFVTLHDADDWCHPDRIARQMQHLLATPDQVACLSQQARLSPDLCLTRLSPEAGFVIENPASLLFRKEPVMARLGGWDSVRVSGDYEFIRRIRRLFGPRAVGSLSTGPLALLRDQAGSAVRSGALAIDGHVSGARLAYLDAQEHFHRTAPDSALRYAPGSRPFPAPMIMVQRPPETQVFSALLAADLRREDDVTKTCLRLADAVRGPVGIIALYRPLSPDGVDPPLRLCRAVCDQIAQGKMVQLCPGEAAEAPLMVLPDPEALMDLPRSLPDLTVDHVRLYADHAPVAHLRGSGRTIKRYDPALCEISARTLADAPAEWHAGRRALRGALTRSGASRVADRPVSPVSVERVLQ